MDALRLILLIVGVVVVAAIYFYSRQARQERRRTQEMRELFEARGEALDDIPELDRSAAVLPDGSEAALDEEFARLSELVVEQGPPRHATDKASADSIADEEVPHSPSQHAGHFIEHPTGHDTRHDTGPAGTSPGDETGEELIIVCHVMAHEGTRFTGADILAATAEAGFEHGEMSIFHDLVTPEGEPATGSKVAGKRQAVLSLANALEPGTFDPDAMDGFTSPGLTLFLRLPGPLEGRAAFERLLSKGRQLAGRLNGELCDETRSVLTPQTVSHLREQVEAFRFKQQMARLGKQRK